MERIGEMRFTQAAKCSSTKALAIFSASSSEPQVTRTTMDSDTVFMDEYDLFPSPLMGEGEGGGGKVKFIPPPLHPLPPGEGRVRGLWGDQWIIKARYLLFIHETLFSPASFLVIDVEDRLVIFPFQDLSCMGSLGHR